jgi:hypothetical protein
MEYPDNITDNTNPHLASYNMLRLRPEDVLQSAQQLGRQQEDEDGAKNLVGPHS